MYNSTTHHMLGFVDEQADNRHVTESFTVQETGDTAYITALVDHLPNAVVDAQDGDGTLTVKGWAHDDWFKHEHATLVDVTPTSRGRIRIKLRTNRGDGA